MNAAQADAAMKAGKITNWSYGSNGEIVVKQLNDAEVVDPTWAKQAPAEERSGGAGAGEGK